MQMLNKRHFFVNFMFTKDIFLKVDVFLLIDEQIPVLLGQIPTDIVNNHSRWRILMLTYDVNY